MNVLVVDDNEVALTLLAATVTEAGYQVTTARNGLEAIDRIRSGGFQLVVSDWEMPGLNGLELCRAVRAAGLPGYVYFVLVTSHDSPEDTVEGLTAGADDFIGKPFNPAELVARLRVGHRVISIETRDVAIFAMAKLAESRDPETGAHLDRVRSYCRVLAVDLAAHSLFQPELDSEFVKLIYLTSPLHDIGKVGIPDCVLLKSGRLTDREFDIMKEHALLGAKTLDAALRTFPGAKFLEMARDIAASHHEWWNGSGYPHGLAGSAIPLCGRIVALADVYDALTSKRVYKAAFTHEVARSIIVEESATHFDPEVVEAFLRTEEEFVTIRARHAEPVARAA